MGFYNRSAYRFNGVSIPQCFLEVDREIASIKGNHRITSMAETLAENVCRRMADIDLFSALIEQVSHNNDRFVGAVAVSSYLVAYLSACKSFMDSGAVSLTILFNLQLPNREQDFSKGRFWNRLSEAQPQVHSRYNSFRSLCTSIVKWRDAAVHRITPLVMVTGPGNPTDTPQEQMEIKMYSEPDKAIADIVQNISSSQWVDPLHLHRTWRPDFIHLCEELSKDIIKSI